MSDSESGQGEYSDGDGGDDKRYSGKYRYIPQLQQPPNEGEVTTKDGIPRPPSLSSSFEGAYRGSGVSLPPAPSPPSSPGAFSGDVPFPPPPDDLHERSNDITDSPVEAAPGDHQEEHVSREPSPSPVIREEEEEDAGSQSGSTRSLGEGSNGANGAVVNGGYVANADDITATGIIEFERQTLMLQIRKVFAVSESAVEVDEDDVETQRLRETLFFLRSKDKCRIDYVLVYEDEQSPEKIMRRENFEQNLLEEGVLVETDEKEDSVDGKSYFTKVHATWEALLTGAELMNMQKKLKMPKSFKDSLGGACARCCDPFEVDEPIVTSEDDYFTSGFSRAMMHTFDIDENNKEDFFTNAERSLIVKEILDRTPYTATDAEQVRMGIGRLLRSGVYTAAYPLHEGQKLPITGDNEPWEGIDKDRQRLYEAWARPGRFLCYQPLDLIRKYFGEKVGIYFAWLGFYTAMLIPASLIGLAAFIYGCVTLLSYPPSNEVCDFSLAGNITMCPECDQRCSYWRLQESCLYSRITYVFDNYATVAFAGFMSLWATVFLEFWKRKQKELEYDWDVSNFELEERMRPEFELKVRKRKVNPITNAMEPYLPWYQKFPRQCISVSVALFFLLLVVAAIFGVIIYRIIIIAVLYAVEPNETFAKLGTSISASIINLIIILILNLIYRRVAWFLTDLERPRTDTEFEDSFTFKMFLFQFVNFYGTIFYIAYFKGRFAIIPGIKEYYIFGYRPDTCDPSGCLVDLFIQLAVIMIGKQFINNIKELLMPLLMSCVRTKKSSEKETSSNLYMRWEQDKDLTPQNELGLFEEYLEMVIQYGFVTIFVAAFPLAPLFALINNVIEIRLDAYKFVCAWRRAPAYKAQDIGVWYGILQGISFIAVLSNAFIIGWTSDFIPKLFYMFAQSPDGRLNGYVNSSLSYFALTDFLNDTRPLQVEPQFNNLVFCRFKGYYELPGTEEQYDYTKTHWNIFAARLAFILVFEHMVFLLTWIVATVIPDTPAWVKQLQLYEYDLIKKMRFDAAFGDDSPLRAFAKRSIRMSAAGEYDDNDDDDDDY